jgi:hypothetical protein
MECIDFIQSQSETLDIGTSMLELQPGANFHALHIFFHFIVVTGIVQIGVEKGPTKEFFDVLAFDGGQGCVEEPARQISDGILRTFRTESEEFLALFLRRGRRM